MMNKEIKTKVLQLLSKDKRISRSELIRRTGAPDRAVRIAIRQLRDEGHPICSSSSAYNYGYWIARNKEEWGHYIEELDHRGKTLRDDAEKARKLLPLFDEAS
jgi:biotin operon repressor